MSMGNYLCGYHVQLGVMAARNESFGVDHPTIVPTNFEAETEAPSADEETAATEDE